MEEKEGSIYKLEREEWINELSVFIKYLKLLAL